MHMHLCIKNHEDFIFWTLSTTNNNVEVIQIDSDNDMSLEDNDSLVVFAVWPSLGNSAPKSILKPLTLTFNTAEKSLDKNGSLIILNLSPLMKNSCHDQLK